MTNFITTAKDITPGMWIIPEGSEYPSEVYKVTCSNRSRNIETGRMEYRNRRFYFTSANGAKHGAEYGADTLVATY